MVDTKAKRIRIQMSIRLRRNPELNTCNFFTHGSKTFFDIGEFIITVTSRCLLVPEPVSEVNDAPAIEAGEMASHL